MKIVASVRFRLRWLAARTGHQIGVMVGGVEASDVRALTGLTMLGIGIAIADVGMALIVVGSIVFVLGVIGSMR